MSFKQVTQNEEVCDPRKVTGTPKLITTPCTPFPAPVWESSAGVWSLLGKGGEGWEREKERESNWKRRWRNGKKDAWKTRVEKGRNVRREGRKKRWRWKKRKESGKGRGVIGGKIYGRKY